ncbi:MAG: lamin tail domain-containing protein, partial [Verrucomicrobiota bacterium]
ALDRVRFHLNAPRRPGPRDLLPAEIHYNPSDEGDYEFIELRNTTPDRLDVSRCVLTGGVGLVLPAGTVLAPGEAIVAVRDLLRFADRYQTPGSPGFRADIRVVGPWVGALDNAGERVVLLGADGVELWSVRYSPDVPWPRRADGRGRSLVLSGLPDAVVDRDAVNAFLGDGRHWYPSLQEHGTPGWEESFRVGFRSTPDGPRLEWPAVAGETYRVESIDLLVGGSWMPVEQGIAPRDELRGLLIPTGGPAMDRFYRVVWVR